MSDQEAPQLFEKRAAKAHDSEGNLVGYYIDADAWREVRALIASPGTEAILRGEIRRSSAALALFDRIVEERDRAQGLLTKIERLMTDPWEARNHGEMARYQEGVSRRGAVAYGEYVKVSDLKAVFDGKD